MSGVGRRLARFLPRGRFVRAVAMVAGGTLLGQGLTSFAAPLLTRLYTPDDFGTLAVFTSILSLLIAAGMFRYEVALPLPPTDEDAADLLLLCCLILLGMGAATSAVVWWGGGWVVERIRTPALLPYLWLLPLSLAGAGLYQCFNYWALRKADFRRVATAKVTQSVSQVALQVGVGLVGPGPLGLLAGHAAGQAGGTTALAAAAWRRDRAALGQASFAGARRALVRYRRFALLAAPSAVLGSAGLQAPALLLAASYGTDVVGQFALGQRVFGIAMVLIGQAVSQVYAGEAARLARESPALLAELFSATARRLLLAGLVPMALLALAGPWLFRVVFGEGWAEAGAYSRLLAPMSLVQFVVVPLSYTLDALERQDLQLAWDAGRLLAVALALAVPPLLGWAPRLAIAAYGMAMTLTYGLLYLICARAIRDAQAPASERG